MSAHVIDDIKNITEKISKRNQIDCNVLLQHIENLNVLEKLYDDKNLETLEKFSDKSLELTSLIDGIIFRYKDLGNENGEKHVMFLNKIKHYMENIEKFSDTVETLNNLLNNYENSSWYSNYTKVSNTLHNTINESEIAVSSIFKDKKDKENTKNKENTNNNTSCIVFFIIAIIVLIVLIFFYYLNQVTHHIDR